MIQPLMSGNAPTTATIAFENDCSFKQEEIVLKRMKQTFF
jgi:hypothetical protein